MPSGPKGEKRPADVIGAAVTARVDRAAPKGPLTRSCSRVTSDARD